MAQGRILNKSISTDPEFNGMSSQAQLLYLKTIPHLDRNGLILGHLSRLWATIDPFHADILGRMGEYVQEWLDAGLVLRYDTGSEQVLFFTGFRKNNPNFRYEKEAPSHFPPPPGWVRTRAGLMPENEELRYHLAQKVNPRSDYHEVLLAQTPPAPPAPAQDATRARPGREPVTTTTRPGRDQVARNTIQNKQHVVDVVQTNNPPPPGSSLEGGVGEMVHSTTIRISRTRRAQPSIWRNLVTPPCKAPPCN